MLSRHTLKRMMSTATPPPTTSTPALNFHALGARLHSSPPSKTSPHHARSPLLLILDLHGVLVQRISGKDGKYLRQSTLEQRRPWTKFNRHDIWLRPHLTTFLSICTSRHNLAIWSAGQPQNVKKLLERMSNHLSTLNPPLIDCITNVWDRSLCRTDPDPTNGKYQVLKYLPDIWNRFNNQQFSHLNTIIIEDTFNKIRHNHHSAIVMPEYSIKYYPDTYNNDDSLLWLLLYIEYLVDASGIEKQHKRNSAVPGIAEVRPSLYTFEQFWRLGFHEAYTKGSPFQLENYESLAYVFFPQDLVDDAHKFGKKNKNKKNNVNESKNEMDDEVTDESAYVEDTQHPSESIPSKNMGSTRSNDDPMQVHELNEWLAQQSIEGSKETMQPQRTLCPEVTTNRVVSEKQNLNRQQMPTKKRIPDTDKAYININDSSAPGK